MPTPQPHANPVVVLSDELIVERVADGDAGMFEILMRRHNQQIYRTIRAILGEDAEVEDAMQQAYIAAYTHLAQFDRRARFSTWLIRIAANEALGRLRKRTTLAAVSDDAPTDEAEMNRAPDTEPNPEQKAQSRELVGWLEKAIDELPEIYRTVFMLREVQELSTAEAAEILGVSEEVAKTRLHRAKSMTREAMEKSVGLESRHAFQFHASRCDRVVNQVTAALAALAP